MPSESLWVQHEDRKSSVVDGFALGAPLLLELVDRNDTPRTIAGKFTDPLDVRCIARKALAEMNDWIDVRKDF